MAGGQRTTWHRGLLVGMAVVVVVVAVEPHHFLQNVHHRFWALEVIRLEEMKKVLRLLMSTADSMLCKAGVKSHVFGIGIGHCTSCTHRPVCSQHLVG